MKPLIYYCRWQGAKLRLRGRNESGVWGQLVFPAAGGERTQDFRFNLDTWALTLVEADGDRIILLDEMGTEREPS